MSRSAFPQASFAASTVLVTVDERTSVLYGDSVLDVHVRGWNRGLSFGACGFRVDSFSDDYV